MQITTELAHQIRSRARQVLDRDVAIANISGIVISSSHHNGVFASDALRAAQAGSQITGQLSSSSVIWSPFVYEQQTIGVFGVSLYQGQLTAEALNLLQGLAEVIIHQYYLLDRVQSGASAQTEFLKDFLTSSSIDHDSVKHQADILQLNLRAPQAVLLTRLHGFESSVHAGSAHLSAEEQRLELVRATDRVVDQIKQGLAGVADSMASYFGEDTFVILKPVESTNPNPLNTLKQLTEAGHSLHRLLKEPQQKPTVGVGQFYSDLGGMRKSYQDASLALMVGSKVWGPGRVYHIKQVGMFITLANIPQDRKAELAHQILHPLLRDEQLYKTVRLFLDSGLNLTAAAQNLHIHRNTLIYRLDKTKKLIGLDPRHFDDALQIKLGLMFYQPA